MNLVVDIGNTKISFGVFKDEQISIVSGIVYPKTMTKQSFEQILLKILPQVNIDNCIISSVVDEVTDIVRDTILDYVHVNAIVLNSDMDLGIKIKSKSPQTIGTDRIANVFAASKLYKQRPLIVVDSGSATTFDIIDSEGVFIGGMILPGLMMQLKALGANTSKLPELNLDMIKKVQTVINSDTQKEILSGVVNGHAQAIQGLIVKSERELKKKAYVVGTGGDAILIDEFMKYKKFDEINPYLTLQGINMIYERNAE